MVAWNSVELTDIGDTEELVILPVRASGRLTTSRTIWVVRVADEIYIRSFRGPTGGWYRQILQTHQAEVHAAGRSSRVVVDDAPPSVRGEVDAAYRTKYGRYGAAYIGPLTSDQVAGTTLRMRPSE